jgi:hypothetical protein
MLASVLFAPQVPTVVFEPAFGPAPLMSFCTELNVASLSASMPDFQGSDVAELVKRSLNLPTLGGFKG